MKITTDHDKGQGMGELEMTKPVTCPECGSADVEMRGPTEIYGIETYFKQCQNCGWRWDPE